MAGVHQAPRRGKGGAPSVDPEAIDLADPEAALAWLTHLESGIEDAIAAGEDATRPPGRRLLGRAMARSHVLDARRSLRAMIDAARRGLPPEGGAEGGG